MEGGLVNMVPTNAEASMKISAREIEDEFSTATTFTTCIGKFESSEKGMVVRGDAEWTGAFTFTVGDTWEKVASNNSGKFKIDGGHVKYKDNDKTYVLTEGVKDVYVESTDAVKGTQVYVWVEMEPEVSHDWVQLWEGGPKFATMNLGETTVTGNSATYAWTEYGSESDAAATNWTTNWTVPTEREMNELYLAASSYGSEKISCTFTTYEGTNAYGFLFTGKGDYSDNSVFFPIQYGYGNDGGAYYWSGTAKDSSGRYLWLRLSVGFLCSNWNSNSTDNKNLVRPILNDNPGSVRDIYFDKTSTAIGIGAGYARTLTASVSPSNAQDKTVTWSSSDTGVATVDATTGKVTGIARGTATITATSNNDSGLTSTCTVTVVDLGDYVTAGGQGGVVYFYNSKPYIVSIEWSSKSWNNAQTWCSNLGDGWYLPSIDELKTIYNCKDTLNAALSSNGGSQFGVDYYWSSTKYNSICASCIDFRYGTVSQSPTISVCHARAVRAL